MEALKYKDLQINFTTEFAAVCDDKGTGATMPLTFWRPTTSSRNLSNFFSLGDIAIGGYHDINQRAVAAVVSEVDAANGTALRAPDDFEHVWEHTGRRARSGFSVWRPVPPPGYVAMGMVCSANNHKPPLQTIRCVRADLVVASHIGRLIWNDKGSGALARLSTWATYPPEAPAGEAFLTPGTFVGVEDYETPGPQSPSYALRVELPRHMQSAPLLSTYLEQPAPYIPSTCELPWFTVKDPELSLAEQLQRSETYRLERTDKYVSFSTEYNETDTGKLVTWRVPRGEIASYSTEFNASTGIQMAKGWASSEPDAWLSFSARLDDDFSHTTLSAQGWAAMAMADVMVQVPKNHAVEGYVIKSEYRLFRKDGSQLGPDLGYAGEVKLHFRDLAAPPPVIDEAVSALPAPTEETSEVAAHDVRDNTLVP